MSIVFRDREKPAKSMYSKRLSRTRFCEKRAPEPGQLSILTSCLSWCQAHATALAHTRTFLGLFVKVNISEHYEATGIEMKMAQTLGLAALEQIQQPLSLWAEDRITTLVGRKTAVSLNLRALNKFTTVQKCRCSAK